MGSSYSSENYLSSSPIINKISSKRIKQLDKITITGINLGTSLSAKVLYSQGTNFEYATNLSVNNFSTAICSGPNQLYGQIIVTYINFDNRSNSKYIYVDKK